MAFVVMQGIKMEIGTGLVLNVDVVLKKGNISTA